MEKRQRVIVYGRTMILGTLAASLQKQPRFEVIALSSPYPSTQELGELEPDAILFDLENGHPEAAFALLATRPALQIIGIDPDRDQVLVWSGQHLHELSVQDLVAVISSKDTEMLTPRRKDRQAQCMNKTLRP